MKNEGLVNWLKFRISNPLSLQDLSRKCIRDRLIFVANGTGISKRLRSLPLPDRLKRYLMFETNEWEEIEGAGEDATEDGYDSAFYD